VSGPGGIGSTTIGKDEHVSVRDEPEPKKRFDVDAYSKRTQQGRCFVCTIVAGQSEYHHHLVYQDDETIAFLNRYPTLLGYTLVAPKRHVEHLAADLDLEQYLRLQAVVYRVAQAVSAVVPTERIYVMSLGSQQGNAHLHWHVAPLPPGVAYQQQQFHAVMAENGVLEVTPTHSEALAADIRRQLRV
jgi:diadenosine tetraphosphate (Ap4A) HIT family hydrolase